MTLFSSVVVCVLTHMVVYEVSLAAACLFHHGFGLLLDQEAALNRVPPGVLKPQHSNATRYGRASRR